ncbi:hypothetical protein FRC09_000022 [Ceratobasidium sp. 395]|nr:hypothetical protein FRC09_000022 [Ceratobasidium sp. 395]
MTMAVLPPPISPSRSRLDTLNLNLIGDKDGLGLDGQMETLCVNDYPNHPRLGIADMDTPIHSLV